MRPCLICQQYPDRPAVFTEDGEALSYSDLTEQVNRFSRHLPARELVFVMGDNDLPTLVCYLSALMQRAVPLLLPKSLSVVALEQLISVYDPQLLFLPDGQTFPGEASSPIWVGGGYALFCRSAASSSRLHEDLALLLATSGSTGSPKLVRLSASNLISNAQSIAEYLQINPDERAITSLPLNYSYGLSVVNSHLATGAAVILTSRSLMDPRFWRMAAELGASSMAGVPYSYDILLKLRFDRMQLPALRTLTLAGGRLDPAKIAQIEVMCRERGIRFIPMYGQTEATARIAYLPAKDVRHKAGSIGKAIPGGRLWIEGADSSPITVAGEVGELVYQGPNVCLGYAEGRDDLALGDVNRGLLRTGDLARFDEDGCFYIEGRRHRFIKVFGIRVALDAVERMMQSRGLSCAAVGWDDQLALFLECTDEEDLEAVRRETAATLSLHMSAITVRRIGRLPRLATGKVDYPCLSRQI